MTLADDGALRLGRLQRADRRQRGGMGALREASAPARTALCPRPRATDAPSSTAPQACFPSCLQGRAEAVRALRRTSRAPQRRPRALPEALLALHCRPDGPRDQSPALHRLRRTGDAQLRLPPPLPRRLRHLPGSAPPCPEAAAEEAADEGPGAADATAGTGPATTSRVARAATTWRAVRRRCDPAQGTPASHVRLRRGSSLMITQPPRRLRSRPTKIAHDDARFAAGLLVVPELEVAINGGLQLLGRVGGGEGADLSAVCDAVRAAGWSGDVTGDSCDDHREQGHSDAHEPPAAHSLLRRGCRCRRRAVTCWQSAPSLTSACQVEFGPVLAEDEPNQHEEEREDKAEGGQRRHVVTGHCSTLARRQA